MKKVMKKISLNRMETKFMNSAKSKTSDPHRLLINLSGKNTKKGVKNMFLFQILSCTIPGKM